MNLNHSPSNRLTAFFAFPLVAQLQIVSSEECVSESTCLACSEQHHGIKHVFSAWGSRQPPPPTAANATACYSCRLLYYKQLINEYLKSSYLSAK